MSFDFFLKACNFWSKNLPACTTCTSRAETTPHSNVEPSSRKNSEFVDQGSSIFLETPAYTSKLTPPTQLLTSPTSSRQEEFEDSSTNSNSKNYRFSGAPKGRIWSLEEDQLLVSSVNRHNGKNWKSIAKGVPGRTATQCSQRWRRIQPYKSRQPWSKDEDKLILSLIEKHGQNWSLIASLIEGRTGKQVRERFLNKLDKNINRSKFTEEDDELIISLYERLGPKWKVISGNFRGRPENMVKNRFYSHIRKKLLLNPEKYRSVLRNIENETNSVNSTQQLESLDPRTGLGDQAFRQNFEVFLEENEIIAEESGIKAGENQMILEENGQQEADFVYDLAPLTPNYYSMKEEQSPNELMGKMYDSNPLVHESLPEEIEFFDTSNVNQRIFSRGTSDEKNGGSGNSRHLEFRNKMTHEVKEKLKISQQVLVPNQIFGQNENLII